jgi:hypothetical protein
MQESCDKKENTYALEFAVSCLVLKIETLRQVEVHLDGLQTTQPSKLHTLFFL